MTESRQNEKPFCPNVQYLRAHHHTFAVLLQPLNSRPADGLIETWLSDNKPPSIYRLGYDNIVCANRVSIPDDGHAAFIKKVVILLMFN